MAYKITEEKPMPNNSDTQAAIDAGKLLGVHDAKNLNAYGKTGDPFIALPDGFRIESLKEFLPKPEKRLCVQLNELDSFNRYVNEHKDDNTRIFSNIDAEGASFTAILDFHGKDPAECKHKAIYACPKSIEWKRWTAWNTKPAKQTEFAQFLEDNLIDIVDPKGTEILEISTSLEAKQSVQFASGVRLHNGQQKLSYQETIEAKAGEKGELTIPERFTLGLAPFQNGEKYRIEARLRYRINGGTLSFWYELHRPHAIIEDACKGVVESIKQKTGIEPFVGFIAA